MITLAIDPGTTQSGWVLFDGKRVLNAGVKDNYGLLVDLGLDSHKADRLAIEKLVSYGAPIGQETLDTCVWIGRFIEAWQGRNPPELIRRVDVKRHVCGTGTAKDKDVRAALIDRIGPQGTKKEPGPTYGVSSHAWAALGVAYAAHLIAQEFDQDQGGKSRAA